MITDAYTTISPAYGRDYKNRRDAIAAFTAGLDFKMESMMHGGTYCSIRDFGPGVPVEIRYKNKTQVTIYTTPIL